MFLPCMEVYGHEVSIKVYVNNCVTFCSDLGYRYVLIALFPDNFAPAVVEAFRALIFVIITD